MDITRWIVDFERGRRGDVMTRIGGRVAFPDRRAWRGFPAPQAGDEWEVEVVGENPRGTVYFLRPIRRLTTAAEREAKRRAKEQERKLWEFRHEFSTSAASCILPAYDISRFRDWLEKRGLLDMVFQAIQSPRLYFDDPYAAAIEAVRKQAEAEAAALANRYFPSEWKAAGELTRTEPRNEAQYSVCRAAQVLERGEENGYPWIYEEGGVKGWLHRELAIAREWEDKLNASDWAREVLARALREFCEVRGVDCRALGEEGEYTIAPGIVFHVHTRVEVETGVFRKDATTWGTVFTERKWDIRGFVFQVNPDGVTPLAFFTRPNFPAHPDMDKGADFFRARVRDVLEFIGEASEATK